MSKRITTAETRIDLNDSHAIIAGYEALEIQSAVGPGQALDDCASEFN
jgi:hypothetical protein